MVQIFYSDSVVLTEQINLNDFHHWMQCEGDGLSPGVSRFNARGYFLMFWKLVPTSILKLRSCLLISLSKRHSQNYCIFVTKVLISRSSLRIRTLIFFMVCASLTFLCTHRARYVVFKQLIIGPESQGSEAAFRYCSSEKTEEGHRRTQSCFGRYSNVTYPKHGASLLGVHLANSVYDLCLQCRALSTKFRF